MRLFLTSCATLRGSRAGAITILMSIVHELWDCACRSFAVEICDATAIPAMTYGQGGAGSPQGLQFDNLKLSVAEIGNANDN
jgi:hypothetical protein